MSRSRFGIVLAAGKGTRMKSTLPKVLHPILGKPMLIRVLESFQNLNLTTVYLVVGHGSEEVEKAVSSLNWPFKIQFVIQEPQLGTGHAVMQVLPHLPEQTDADVLITCADMPLVCAGHYESLVSQFNHQESPVCMVGVHMPNPTGYGRVILTEEGLVGCIIEERDASDDQKKCTLINTGIYMAHWPTLAPCLNKLNQNNAQGEFYLTDTVGLLHEGGKTVEPVIWDDPEEVMGINSRQHLAEAVEALSRRTAKRLMDEGVTIHQPHTSMIAPEVQIQSDTTIYPGCLLEGEITVGTQSEIGPNTTMRGKIEIGSHCRIVHSHLERRVMVEDHTYVGPYAHLRDNAFIGKQCRIGNFVEVKEARIGNRSNAAHLAYLGDATLGDDVNMGAGSIIANYDPILDLKHQSFIADGVKVGCNSVLISPVNLEANSCVAAGSVITKDVAAFDLAIARGRQTQIPRWVEKTKNKASNPQSEGTTSPR